MSRLIFAIAGTGKTYMVEKFGNIMLNGHRYKLRDGDAILKELYSGKAWPKMENGVPFFRQPDWKMRYMPLMIEHIRRLNYYVEHHREEVVLFSPTVEALRTILKKENLPFASIVIHREEHLRRMRSCDAKRVAMGHSSVEDFADIFQADIDLAYLTVASGMRLYSDVIERCDYVEPVEHLDRILVIGFPTLGKSTAAKQLDKAIDIEDHYKNLLDKKSENYYHDRDEMINKDYIPLLSYNYIFINSLHFNGNGFFKYISELQSTKVMMFLPRNKEMVSRRMTLRGNSNNVVLFDNDYEKCIYEWTNKAFMLSIKPIILNDDEYIFDFLYSNAILPDIINKSIT